MTKKESDGIIAVNKKAGFNYFLEEHFEAGLALQGWEIKSVRAGKIQITDTYVLLRNDEAFLIGMQITPLNTVSTHFVPDAARTRKLLLHRSEIDRLIGLTERKGYTIVLTRLYWKGQKVKCQISVARGKQTHDKRESIKEKDWQREKARVMRHKDR